MAEEYAMKSMAQLRQRKAELRQEMMITQHELKKGLGNLRTQVPSYLLKQVALPAGAGALGLYLLKKIFQNSEESGQVDPMTSAQAVTGSGSSAGTSKIDLAQLIKVGFPLFKILMGLATDYFNKDNSETE